VIIQGKSVIAHAHNLFSVTTCLNNTKYKNINSMLPGLEANNRSQKHRSKIESNFYNHLTNRKERIVLEEPVIHFKIFWKPSSIKPYHIHRNEFCLLSALVVHNNNEFRIASYVIAFTSRW